MGSLIVHMQGNNVRCDSLQLHRGNSFKYRIAIARIHTHTITLLLSHCSLLELGELWECHQFRAGLSLTLLDSDSLL